MVLKALTFLLNGLLEPWRFKGMSYNDRYGWQQPNHLRRTEIPVWTSIELEKPQWNRKRRK